MAVSLMEDRKSHLYGPERNLRYQGIRDTLTKSSVLQDGEYNITASRLRNNVWNTSHSTDYQGAMLDPSQNKSTPSQLVHHFDMGNQSEKLLEKRIYQLSATKDDFPPQPTHKPQIFRGERVTNWTDMAPKYATNRTPGPSEYTSSYITELRTNSAPLYPRMKTSIMQMPIDPKFSHQKDTNIIFGSDAESLISEQQRMYGRSVPAFTKENNLEDTGEMASDTNIRMKNMDKVSHVFRSGDYNDIVGNFETTVTNDFGPRTIPPDEAALAKMREQEKLRAQGLPISQADERDEYAEANQLQKYARSVIVPTIFKTAEDERSYQTSAHFQFGSDDDKKTTIHAKDFALSSMAARQPPTVKSTPDAGKLFQNDTSQHEFGKATASVDYLYHQAIPYKNAAGKTLMEINLQRRDTDNVVFSYDPKRHLQDRQVSTNHSDFTGPPGDFKSMEPPRRPTAVYKYLQTDEALPYPGLQKDQSEAKHNYSGFLMEGSNALERRKWKNSQTKGRFHEGQSTHFTVGYSPWNFCSETMMKFRGESRNDQAIPYAGKDENVHPTKLSYLSHSANTQDLQAADPFITNTRERLHARMNYEPPEFEQSNTTSVTKADYKPLEKRKIASYQARVMDKYDKVIQKDTAPTHFFHTDNSGANQFLTTSMDHYIPPESMTGFITLATLTIACANTDLDAHLRRKSVGIFVNTNDTCFTVKPTTELLKRPKTACN